MAQRYPALHIAPLVADYSVSFDGPAPIPGARRVVFFPGSSVGNFEPDEAVAFLDRCRSLAGPGGVVLVGVDVPKPRAVLERAYDDLAGATRAFNLNLLARMVRELDAELHADDFAHRAVWQEGPSRVQMQLVAQRATRITVGGATFSLEAGEHIVTEHCYKHDEARFAMLARDARLRPVRIWRDPDARMTMHWLEA